jgi:acetolactate synthase-1/2/3 large subunit
MIKVSDFVIKYLENIGVKDVFLLSGGGMMHLLDSLGKSGKINYYCNLNEQATSICADAYAQYTNKLAVCMVTTGPGGTNAITGTVASYLDSEPVLVISGQVKTSDLVGTRGVRQIGPQEVNIVELVRSITKYAAIVLKKEDIRYHLEKATYLASTGRRGPAWVDIPLDVQGAEVDEASLRRFDPAVEGLVAGRRASSPVAGEIRDSLRRAKRPILLLGHGVVAAGAERKARELAERLAIPVLPTWRAKMVLPDDHRLNYGHPGSPGPRYSNFILQNSDFALIIGSRLNVGITAFNERNFAPGARKCIVDIDENEIAKLDMDFEHRLIFDAGDFIDELLTSTEMTSPEERREWLGYCEEMRRRYPIAEERQVATAGGTNMYRFAARLSDYARTDDVIVTASAGRVCGIMNLCFRRREGQVEIGSMALGSMGFALPAAIGACIASGKRRTLALEGDGSLQHNLQELMLIKTYSLPIKLFVLNNGGYASIVTMQKNHFKGNFVACDDGSGLRLPPLNRIAELYGLRYGRIGNDGEIDGGLEAVMTDDSPALCEIIADSAFDEIPKAISKVNPDGTISSSKLEVLFPFLAPEETASAMRYSEEGRRT